MCGNQNDAPSGRIVGGWAAIVSFILVLYSKLAAKYLTYSIFPEE